MTSDFFLLYFGIYSISIILSGALGVVFGMLIERSHNIKGRLIYVPNGLFKKRVYFKKNSCTRKIKDGCRTGATRVNLDIKKNCKDEKESFWDRW